jgi:hypothetical protein
MSTFEIRALQTKDCPTVRTRAEALAARCYPEMVVDTDATVALLRELVASDRHYARVVGEVGAPKAALLAVVMKNVWALKKRAVVLCWYSELPGAGAALLRDFRRWVQSQHKQIVLAGFDCDWNLLDERVLQLAERADFKLCGTGGYRYFPRKVAPAATEPFPSKQEALERLRKAEST